MLEARRALSGISDQIEIEKAYNALKVIIESVRDVDLLRESEADARLKLIDPILQDCLGWPLSQIRCEKSLDNSRLDYLLTTTTGGAVIEAKRAAIQFNFTDSADKPWYPLSGVILKSGYNGSAITQAKAYAQKHGISLAAATNGVQWIVFLASREDGVPPDSGFAYVFRSLEDLSDPNRFVLFYSLLSKKSILSQQYKAAFYKAEGRLKAASHLRATRLVEALKGSDQKRKKSDIASALDPVIQQLFISMSPEKEREIIKECFVVTKESDEADSRLRRLLDEITDDIKSIDTRDSQDTQLKYEIEKGIDIPDSRTVILIGQIGSGKTTYLHRFFEDILSEQLQKKILLIRLDLEKARPDLQTLSAFLRNETIRVFEIAAFNTDYPTFEQLQGAFNSLYLQLSKGKGKPLFQKDKLQFDVLFINTLEELKLSRQEDYMRYLLEHCNKSLKKLPIIIYDNVDHHSNEVQTLTFQHSQWLSGLGRVFSILPMRDSTYWEASTEGPLHTQTHVCLYLPRPPLDKVLAKRFRYAEIQTKRLLENHPVVLNSLHGIRVRVDKPEELFHVLHRVFSREKYPNYLLRGLTGGNIRESLQLFQKTITSPHIPIDRLISAYLTQDNYRLNQSDKAHFDKAVILGDFAHFKQERNRSITNLLCLPKNLEHSPILGLRIIQRLYDMRSEIHPQAGKGFEPVQALLDYFESMGVPRAITEQTILELLKRGLIEPHDVSVFSDPGKEIKPEEVEFVSVSSSGRVHRQWVRESRAYGLEMIRDMALFDADVAASLESMFERRKSARRHEQWAESDNLLKCIGESARNYIHRRDEDALFVPDEDSLFATQRKITETLFQWSSMDSFNRSSDDEEL